MIYDKLFALCYDCKLLLGVAKQLLFILSPTMLYICGLAHLGLRQYEEALTYLKEFFAKGTGFELKYCISHDTLIA
jgi:hypothetical protein